jgi:hypothetical protein
MSDKKKKQFQVKILFDRQESNLFGGLGAQGVTLILDEPTKNTVLDHFLKQESVLTVTLNDFSTRYINTKNILYIDVTEAASEGEKSDV